MAIPPLKAAALGWWDHPAPTCWTSPGSPWWCGADAGVASVVPDLCQGHFCPLGKQSSISQAVASVQIESWSQQARRKDPRTLTVSGTLWSLLSCWPNQLFYNCSSRESCLSLVSLRLGLAKAGPRLLDSELSQIPSETSCHYSPPIWGDLLSPNLVQGHRWRRRTSNGATPPGEGDAVHHLLSGSSPCPLILNLQEHGEDPVLT